MSTASSPIGIFDSGLGGLTVLRQLHHLLPDESLLYYADTANVPYGDKPISIVRELALGLTSKLDHSGVKLVLMASGTSTVAGLQAARSAFPHLPILGTIEAGARAAIGHEGPIGVLATDATARSRAFTDAIHALDASRTVHEVGCPDFVPLVESGRANSPEAIHAARTYLAPLLEQGICTVILGCTHFPFLLPALRYAMETAAQIAVFVDPAEEAVLEAEELLRNQGLLAVVRSHASTQFFATGNTREFHRQASRLLGYSLPEVDRLKL